ncbi:hypothetical protein ScPMuIL_016036 [Solemya velum]
MPEGNGNKHYSLIPSYQHGGHNQNANILKSVQEQEIEFERLRRELEAERQDIAHKADQLRVGSETASMASISSTDESFHWRGPPPHEPNSYFEENSGQEPSNMSSHLLDSCLRELENRGTLNSGYVRDNMEYIQEDPYRGQGRHYTGDPYGSPTMNGPAYSPHNDLSPHSSRVSLQSMGSNRNALQSSKGFDVLPGNRGSLSSQTREQPTDNYMPYSAINQNYSQDPQGSPPNSRFNDHYQPSSMEPYNQSELDMYNHVTHRDMNYPGNRESYDHPPSDHGGQRYADSSFDDRFQNRNNAINGQPEDSFYRNSPIDTRYKPHSEHYNSPDPEDSFHGIQYAQRPNDSYREGPGDNSYEDPYRRGNPNNRYMDGPTDDRYQDGPPGDRYGEGPLPDQYNGPLDDRYEGPPEDRYEGPPDDHYGGPPEDRYGGPPEDRYGRPPEDRYGGPPEDHYGGPPEDHYGGPKEDRYGGLPDNRYGGTPEDQYGAPLDDRYADRSASPVAAPPDDHYIDDPYRSREPNDGYGDPLENERLQINSENMQHDPRLQEMRNSPHPDERYRDDYNPSFSEKLNDQYPDYIDGRPPEPHPEPRYRDDEDSFRGPPPSDRYREGPLEGDQYDQNSNPERKHEGLPPVHSDPFADDPFQHGVSAPPRDQYRGSPVPGDKYGYEDQPPEYPYGPPQGYDSMDDHQERPMYEEDLHRQEAPNVRSLPADYHSDGRRTPSIDGRSSRWRNPDLQEVIDFLSSTENSVKANAAAYLQHLCYMDDDMKAKTRSMDGIAPLIELLNNEFPEVHRNACGALKNLSYGKANTENKKFIKNAGGIPTLVRLLRKTQDEDVKESVTGVLWNLSSCEELKQAIIDDGLAVLVNVIVIPQSGWSPNGVVTSNINGLLTTTFRNSTGVLRNVSSSGLEARKKLRECHGLVDSLVHSLKSAIQHRTFDNKPLENIVCTLRNLSFRIQEIEDPDFHKKRNLTLPRQKPSQKAPSGCLGGSKKKNSQSKKNHQTEIPLLQLPLGYGEYEVLWLSEIVKLYLQLLQESSNPVILEAASGAIQNLAACFWQPADEIRAVVRKEKGLPNLVDLLTFDNDRVVCAAATALRNLSIDERNKQLVGKYAMKQLVNKIPSDSRQATPASNETIVAVMATLNEVIKENQVFAQDFLTAGGVQKLIAINRAEQLYQPKTVKYASQLLKVLWTFKTLHTEYAAQGFTVVDFKASGDTATRPGAASPPSSTFTTPYNTLNRPMSGMGYDDSTMSSSRHQQNYPQGNSYGYERDREQQPDSRMDRRQDNYGGINATYASQHLSPEQDPYGYAGDRRGDDLQMQDLGPGYAPIEEQRPPRTKPPVGGVPLFPNLPPSPQSSQPHPSNEPLYAQVKKGNRHRQNDPGPPLSNSRVMLDEGGGQGGADSWV